MGVLDVGVKCEEVVHAHQHQPDVIASHSELLCSHCPGHLLLFALLPACADSQVSMHHDCSAYAVEPLRSEGLLEAAHQHSLQDMCRSTRTSILHYSLFRSGSLRTYFCSSGPTPTHQTPSSLQSRLWTPGQLQWRSKASMAS